MQLEMQLLRGESRLLVCPSYELCVNTASGRAVNLDIARWHEEMEVWNWNPLETNPPGHGWRKGAQTSGRECCRFTLIENSRRIARRDVTCGMVRPFSAAG
ncbi:unnamed protein product [Durusdinium trenchii]|uniref:Uncharacterized protein n=1 Tax=Durusdinium trenchii TaxID=1381693 RepID=A0ABP0PR01_9DINO